MQLLRYSLIFLALTLVVFLQFSRILAIGNIEPNLIFVTLMLLVFSSGVASALDTIIFPIIFFWPALLAFLWAPFWVLPFILLGVISLTAYFLKGRITGDPLADFLLSIFLGTALFYIILNFRNLAALPRLTISFEILYDATLAVIFWIISNRFNFEL
jgi:hypothetical protein